MRFKSDIQDIYEDILRSEKNIDCYKIKDIIKLEYEKNMQLADVVSKIEKEINQNIVIETVDNVLVVYFADATALELSDEVIYSTQNGLIEVKQILDITDEEMMHLYNGYMENVGEKVEYELVLYLMIKEKLILFVNNAYLEDDVHRSLMYHHTEKWKELVEFVEKYKYTFESIFALGLINEFYMSISDSIINFGFYKENFKIAVSYQLLKNEYYVFKEKDKIVFEVTDQNEKESIIEFMINLKIPKSNLEENYIKDYERVR